jgi:hypothetical protein
MKLLVGTISLLTALSLAHTDDTADKTMDPNLAVGRAQRPSKAGISASRDGTVLGKGTDCPTCKILKSAGNADCGQDDCRRIKHKKSKQKERENATK